MRECPRNSSPFQDNGPHPVAKGGLGAVDPREGLGSTSRLWLYRYWGDKERLIPRHRIVCLDAVISHKRCQGQNNFMSRSLD